MGTSLNRTMRDLDIIGHQVFFTEVQIHDKLKQNTDVIRNVLPPTKYKGYFTIHGEGETDGKVKIKFSYNDTSERKRYVIECISLYSFILKHLCPYKTFRLILHPDTFSSKIERRKQIELLATSLTEIADKVKDIEFVCIEPRGDDRQRKVLRANIEDLRILEEQLNANGLNNIGLCIDIAQLFVVYGNDGTAQFLKDIKSIKLAVKEFHISDVLQNVEKKNRVAMEVGTGAIDWKLILPLVLEHCNEFLIETLGGIKVFEKSKKFLESLVTNTTL